MASAVAGNTMSVRTSAAMQRFTRTAWWGTVDALERSELPA
jgi:hypothetical protein